MYLYIKVFAFTKKCENFPPGRCCHCANSQSPFVSTSHAQDMMPPSTLRNHITESHQYQVKQHLFQAWGEHVFLPERTCPAFHVPRSTFHGAGSWAALTLAMVSHASCRPLPTLRCGRLPRPWAAVLAWLSEEPVDHWANAADTDSWSRKQQTHRPTDRDAQSHHTCHKKQEERDQCCSFVKLESLKKWPPHTLVKSREAQCLTCVHKDRMEI